MVENEQNHTDTFQWDTVYALHIEDINREISRNKKTTPPKFSYISPDGWSAEANFETWQIVDGGDGKLLHFSLPVSSGNLNYDGKDIPFKNANVIIELELAFFNSTDQPSGNQSGSFHHLKTKTKPNGNDDKIITVLKISFSEKQNSFMLKALLPNAIENWLNNNLDIFDHIFATVNLNGSINNGKFDWVTPSFTDYAFISNKDTQKSCLGILCMTENRSIQGLSAQISPFVIPPGSRGGYLISNNRVLEKLVKPAIPMVFKNFDLNDLELSPDNNSLQLIKDKKITIPIEHHGDTYDCDLEILTVFINESYVEIHFKGKTGIGLDIESHVESTHKYKIQIKNKADGKQTLDFVQFGDPIEDHWTTQPAGLIIAEIVLGIIAAILIIILTILTDGAILIVGALIIGLLSGAAIATPQVVGLVGKDDAPDLELLISNSISPINWTGKGKFDLNVAGLCGCLQLGGTYAN